MAITKRIFPRRNLPGLAENWGREVEGAFADNARSLTALSQTVNNMRRSTSSQLSLLADQLQDLRGREAYAPAGVPDAVSRSTAGLYSMEPSQTFTIDVPRKVKLTASSQVGVFVSGTLATAHLSFDLNGSSLLANNVARGFVQNGSAGTMIQQTLTATTLLDLQPGTYTANPNVLVSLVGAGTVTTSNVFLFVEILQVV